MLRPQRDLEGWGFRSATGTANRKTPSGTSWRSTSSFQRDWRPATYGGQLSLHRPSAPPGTPQLSTPMTQMMWSSEHRRRPGYRTRRAASVGTLTSHHPSASTSAASSIAPSASLPHIPSPLSKMPPEGDADADFARYVEVESVFEALGSGHVRLIRLTWLLRLWRSQARSPKPGLGRVVLPRRQGLPEEAFISVDELRRMHQVAGVEAGVKRLLPVISISACWLSRDQ